MPRDIHWALPSAQGTFLSSESPENSPQAYIFIESNWKTDYHFKIYWLTAFFRKKYFLRLINIKFFLLERKLFSPIWVSVWSLSSGPLLHLSCHSWNKMTAMFYDVTRVLPLSIAPEKPLPPPPFIYISRNQLWHGQGDARVKCDRQQESIQTQCIQQAWRVGQLWGPVRKPTHASFFFLFSFSLNIKLFLRK